MTQSFSEASIGPRIDLQEFRLPPHVGRRLATLFDHDEPITSGDEWVTAMRQALEANRGRAPTEADLCHAEDGAHTVDIGGERQSFVCVLDPLIVSFLRGEPGRVESETPEDDGGVTVDITADGAVADPADAVVSLGVSHHVGDEPPTPETVYRQVCGYIHVFGSAEEYERWADGVDAATTSVTVDTGVAVARELATALFEN